MAIKDETTLPDLSKWNDVGKFGKYGIYASKNCKKCFGRGWIGTDTQTKQRIPCSCLIRVNHEEALEKLERALKEMKNEY